MNWSDVGQWVKKNAGPGAALIGSLLTGNAPGAVAAGIAMVSGATGTDDPDQILQRLQTDPNTIVKLKEIAAKEEDSIRRHLADMKRMELEDTQHEHRQTQQTVRSGDNAEDPFVRRTRPGQSWLSLFAALAYVFAFEEPDIYVLVALLTLPWTYAGLRQVGKGVDSIAGVMATRQAGKGAR